MWPALTILAVLSLAIFWRGPNAVGGGMTLGFIGGLITAFVKGFAWVIVGKGVIIGILTGLFFELVFIATKRRNRR